MRILGLLLVSACLFAVGCDAPKESVPAVVPTVEPTVEPTSGTTADEHAGHDHGDEAKKETSEPAAH